MANTAPIFGLTPNVGKSSLSVANTNRDGTGSSVTVFTAGTAGSMVNGVVIKATATTTAGMIRLFYYDGSSYFLAEEISVSAITPSASVQSFTGTSSIFNRRPLPSGSFIKAATHNGETFHVTVFGEDF